MKLKNSEFKYWKETKRNDRLELTTVCRCCNNLLRRERWWRSYWVGVGKKWLNFVASQIRMPLATRNTSLHTHTNTKRFVADHSRWLVMNTTQSWLFRIFVKEQHPTLGGGGMVGHEWVKFINFKRLQSNVRNANMNTKCV